MEKARQRANRILYPPFDALYDEDAREYQGVPTIAVTRGGRIFTGWYSGGDREPHIDNYLLPEYSDDGGKSWSGPLLIIPSSREDKVHTLDPQLWLAPDGRLILFWVQNNVELRGDVCDFYDVTHSEWAMSCSDPDAEAPFFSAPRLLYPGFLHCKPLILASGRQLHFSYDQLTDRYGYCFSDDCGKTYTRRYGGKKLPVYFDEAMAYQRSDGSIRMLARSVTGELAKSISADDGMTRTDGLGSGIVNPDSRFFVSKLPSGRVLLINNDHPTLRTNLTLSLSEDDGATWKYRLCIDRRDEISYPDADCRDGIIYLIYDRERCDSDLNYSRRAAREILFARFTEEDVINARDIPILTVSRPRKTNK